MKYIALFMYEGKLKCHSFYYDSEKNISISIIDGKEYDIYVYNSLELWKQRLGNVKIIKVSDRQLEELQRKDSSLLSWIENNFPEVLLFMEEWEE